MHANGNTRSKRESLPRDVKKSIHNINQLTKKRNRPAKAPELNLHSIMIMFAFANAIREALGSVVPCALPYSDITPLQLIRDGYVHKNRGYWIFDDTHVAVNPGNPADTLLACFDQDEEVFKKLKSLAVGTTNIRPLDVTLDVACHASLTANVLGSQWLTAALLSDGVEVDINQNWDLSIAGNVQKRAVAVTQLENIVNNVRIGWFSDLVVGVVTAVYVITGGLCYKGKARVLTHGRAESAVHTIHANVNDNTESVARTETTIEVRDKTEALAQTGRPNADVTDASVPPTPGWTFTLTGTNEIVLTERDPVDWIVAIEYLKLRAYPVDDDNGQWLELRTGDEVIKLPPF